MTFPYAIPTFVTGAEPAPTAYVWEEKEECRGNQLRSAKALARRRDR